MSRDKYNNLTFTFWNYYISGYLWWGYILSSSAGLFINGFVCIKHDALLHLYEYYKFLTLHTHENCRDRMYDAMRHLFCEKKEMTRERDPGDLNE
jgi:hypothetical protein